MEKIKFANIELNLNKQDKFNSNLLSIYLKRPLNRKEVTLNNLLAKILARGSENFPDILTINKELERLYGAVLLITTNTLASFQLLNISIQFVNNKFIQDEKFFKDILNLVFDILFNPKFVDGKFDEEYIIGEKRNLKEVIENEINDKRTYSINRTLNEMFKDEVYGIDTEGYIEDIDEISGEILTEHYKNIINNSKIGIYYSADYSEREIEILKEKIKSLNILNENVKDLDIIKPNNNTKKKFIEDKLNVNQGKIVLGYKTNIVYGDEDYYPLLVGNVIFGASSNSKLFMNVREKHSLAYYIHSRIYKYSAGVLVEAGIEFDKFEETKDLVNLQLEEMKKGNFTQEDIELAVNILESSIISTEDSLNMTNILILENDLNKLNLSQEDKLEKIKAVEKEEIIKAMKNIELDTIYFMNRGEYEED